MPNINRLPNEDFTPRELVGRAIRHKETPRVPFSTGLGANLPVRLSLMEHLGHTNLGQTDEYLLGYSDIRSITPPFIGPAGKCLTFPDGRTSDIWGVVRKPVTYTDNGAYDEICHYPLAKAECVKDLDAFEWPSADWYDYAALPDVIRKADPEGRYAIMLGNGNIFETTWYMRGFEQTLMDMMAEPELLDAIFERVTSFYIEYFDRALTAARGLIDIAFTADDIAGQNGLLFSPALWKERLVPWHKKMNDRLHEHGVKVLYHTDGAAHSVVKDLIDMGIDGWDAVQMDARGMDAEALKDAAGDKLFFHGGISVQQLLPFASPDEVRSEVARLMRCLGRGGGYIVAPSHTMQAGTPPENILAMLETVRPAR